MGQDLQFDSCIGICHDTIDCLLVVMATVDMAPYFPLYFLLQYKTLL
jgi:hypothetical protein